MPASDGKTSQKEVAVTTAELTNAAPSEIWPDDADPITWTLARQVWIDHTPNDNAGDCSICHEQWPCGPRQSARLVITLGARCGWFMQSTDSASLSPTDACQPEVGSPDEVSE